MLMKKLTLPRNKTFLKIWGLYHGLIVAAFAVFFVLNGGYINIDADLFNMLPKPLAGEALEAADAKMTEITGQNVYILVSNPDFAKAKEAADQVYSQLNGSSKFKSVTLYQNTAAYSDIADFLVHYRDTLLDKADVDAINEEGGAEAFADAVAYNMYTSYTTPSNLDTDPFMIMEKDYAKLLNFLSKSGIQMQVKDDVMAAEHEFDGEKRWYVMIRGALSKEGAALASSSNAVVLIHNVCSQLEKDGTRFTFSGTPFHSYKSSTNASREIAIISSVSMAVVLIILLLIFKRPHPIVFSIGSILVSSAIAICTTLLVFRKMHILTLVFGTSLIGSCIDYSLHYFINWKGNTDYHTGDEIREHLFKGLALSLISTCLCYFVLVFAPFNLLRQMAVFSMSGIISTFLSVICVYPYISVPKTDKQIVLMHLMKTPSWYNKKKVGRTVISAMFGIAFVLLFVFRGNLSIKNDLKNLYKAEGRELHDQIEAAKVLQYSPSGWFIVSGSTPEETLVNEESVVEKLIKLETDYIEEWNAAKAEQDATGVINPILGDKPKNTGFMCTSAFIPSQKRQKESLAAVEKLLPYADRIYDLWGEDASKVKALKADFENRKNDLILIGTKEEGGNVPSMIMDTLSAAWLGKIGDKYYSVVLPATIVGMDSDPVVNVEKYREIADSDENVFFVSKVNDMNADLDELSWMVVKLFIIVYVLIFIVLKKFYTLKQTLKVISVPLLIVLYIAAIFAMAKINLEFFSITGMILVFGLGLDYVIYMIENERRKDISENGRLEPFAIMLSFITTAVSFGSLALSAFAPVHLMGLSIFIGLTTAFVSTFFYTRTKF